MAISGRETPRRKETAAGAEERARREDGGKEEWRDGELERERERAR